MSAHTCSPFIAFPHPASYLFSLFIAFCWAIFPAPLLVIWDEVSLLETKSASWTLRPPVSDSHIAGPVGTWCHA